MSMMIPLNISIRPTLPSSNTIMIISQILMSASNKNYRQGRNSCVGRLEMGKKWENEKAIYLFVPKSRQATPVTSQSNWCRIYSWTIFTSIWSNKWNISLISKFNLKPVIYISYFATFLPSIFNCHLWKLKQDLM